MELVQLDSLCQDLRDLQGVVKILKDDNESVKSDYEASKIENRAFKDRLEKLSTTVEVQSAAERRKEVFYQEWLESVLGGKHKRLSIGVTDVSNDELDVEIKVYRNAAMAVAQLNLYNSLTNAPNKVLALFDTPPKWKPSNGLVEICDLHAVRLVLLREDMSAKGVETKFGKDSNWCDDVKMVQALFTVQRPVQSLHRSAYVRFVDIALLKQETKDAFFRLKDAHKLWTHLSELQAFAFLRPVPKQCEMKVAIGAIIEVPCQERPTVTCPDQRKQPRSAYRGYLLRSLEDVKNALDLSHL